MYRVKVVENAVDLAQLILIASESTYHEYDCSRDDYLNHIVKVVYLSNSYRATLLYLDDTAVGYFISRFDDYLYTEINVVDVYIDKNHQGQGCIQLLIEDMAKIAFASKAKRIKWHSHVFGKDFWKKHSFGIEVEKCEVFYVNTEENVETFESSSKKLKERF